MDGFSMDYPNSKIVITRSIELIFQKKELYFNSAFNVVMIGRYPINSSVNQF